MKSQKKTELLVSIERAITIVQSEVKFTAHNKEKLIEELVAVREKIKAESNDNKSFGYFSDFLSLVFKIRDL